MNRITIMFLLLMLMLPMAINAQDSLSTDPPVTDTPAVPLKQRYGIWFAPTKVNKIHGLTLGWLFLNALDDKKEIFIINGAYVNISPVQALFALIGVPYLIPLPFKQDLVEGSETDSIHYNHKLNGIAVSIVELSNHFNFNGIQVSGVLSGAERLNGISISGVAGIYGILNGIMISGYYNRLVVGRGIQIGLFNNTEQLNGVQIGLWNKIGKRQLPILNFSFKQITPEITVPAQRNNK